MPCRGEAGRPARERSGRLELRCSVASLLRAPVPPLRVPPVRGGLREPGPGSGAAGAGTRLAASGAGAGFEELSEERSGSVLPGAAAVLRCSRPREPRGAVTPLHFTRPLTS